MQMGPTFGPSSRLFEASSSPSPLLSIVFSLPSTPYANILIHLIKLVAYLQTLSIVVLASLADSLLDAISQWVFDYTSSIYPAGAARK